MLAIGCRLSAVGSRLSAVGSRLSAVGYRLSALDYRLSALGSRLSALGSRLSPLAPRPSPLRVSFPADDQKSPLSMARRSGKMERSSQSSAFSRQPECKYANRSLPNPDPGP